MLHRRQCFASAVRSGDDYVVRRKGCLRAFNAELSCRTAPGSSVTIHCCNTGDYCNDVMEPQLHAVTTELAVSSHSHGTYW